MENIQTIKQRFGIIGNDPKLNRALEKAAQVAPTDISVLVTGESGVGKEAIPKIIHSLSLRKHGKYIAVNCGAIPEGTIDSELFGHEKGAFTGANINGKKGYFEVANNGVLFLDEIGELQALKKELKALKEAFAETTLENKVYKTYFQILGQETGMGDEIKKKLEQELLKYFPKQKR